MTLPQVKRAVQAKIKPYVHKDAPIYDTWIRLDRNESRFGISPNVEPALKAEFPLLSRYPENTAVKLRQVLADYYHLDPDQFLIGNGSYELIWLLSSLFLDPGDEVLTSETTFASYGKYGQLGEGVVKKVPLTADLQVDLEGILGQLSPKTRLVWVCNPNNPTGKYIEEKRLAAFLDRVPEEVLVVLDEAYIEFLPDFTPELSMGLLQKHKNLLLLRTFSKFYGLASLRLGYAMGDKTLIDTIFQYRIPPNHNRLAAVAARVSLQDAPFQQQVRKTVEEERQYLYSQFDRLGIPYEKTVTNFYLLHTGKQTEAIRQALHRAHILVKQGSLFGLPEDLRISVGDREADEKLVEVLEKERGV
jgi:histidinol-phosphate aminotransferase